MSKRRPLYGHVSPETAYLVDDYPYGRKVRCRIRYWLEKHPKRGVRFVSQTEHPRSKTWNKPKASTYARLAGCMYLDEQSHVHWACLSEYADGAEARDFVAAFPEADLETLMLFALQKVRYLALALQGKVYVAINGKRQPRTEADDQRDRDEQAAWQSMLNADCCVRLAKSLKLYQASRKACGASELKVRRVKSHG